MEVMGSSFTTVNWLVSTLASCALRHPNDKSPAKSAIEIFRMILFVLYLYNIYCEYLLGLERAQLERLDKLMKRRLWLGSQGSEDLQGRDASLAALLFYSLDLPHL